MHPSGAFFVFAIIFLAACGPATPPVALQAEAVRSAHALTVIDDNGVRHTLLLAGVTGPDVDAAPDAARRARQALDNQLGSAAFTHQPVGEPDRYGRMPSRVQKAETGDLAQIMVEAGWLMVWPRLGQPADFDRLYVAESRARNANAGAWGEGAFAVRDPDPNRLAQRLDSAQIIEGRVVSTGAARDGRVFVNFGLDWRTDFTAMADAEAAQRFAARDLDLLALEGAVIRVRGWLFDLNGPSIVLDHPAQLEIVDAPTAPTIPR